MRVQLERLGLPYERFSAVDGREISDEVLRRHYSAELNRRKYYVDLSRSEIACYISHLRVCEKSSPKTSITPLFLKTISF